MKKRVTSCFLFASVLLAALAGGAGSATSAAAASCGLALHAVSVTPGSVPGGAPATVTVTLTCAAPKPVSVRLKGFPGVTVPASVTVPKGKTAASAAVRTATTKKAEHGTIAATLGSVRKTTALAVGVTPRTCKTPVLASFTLPSLSNDSAHPAAVVKLNCAAAAAVRVSLKSGDSYLPVPGTVTIGRYYAAATVPLTPKRYEAGPFKATVTARLGTRSLAKTITVDPGISELAISQESSGPDNFTVEVLTTGVAGPGGMTVSLRSSSPAAVTMPPSFTVQPGSVGGGVAGVTINPVTKTTPVTLFATYGGVTKSASYVLIPPWSTNDTLTITADYGTAPLYGGEQAVNYYIDLSNPAPSSGLTVDVTVADPSALEWELAPPVEILPGWNNGAVSVNVPSDITAPVHTSMTATVDGVSASVPVTIEPGLGSFSVPATITGGGSGTGTISLAGPVDTPTTMSLQSDWGILAVSPGNVTIPKGASSATFQFSTVPVTSDSDVQLNAFLGTTTIESGSIDVTP